MNGGGIIAIVAFALGIILFFSGEPGVALLVLIVGVSLGRFWNWIAWIREPIREQRKNERRWDRDAGEYREIQRDYAAIRKQALASKATKFSELPVMPASIPIPVLKNENFPCGDDYQCVQLGKCRQEEQIGSFTDKTGLSPQSRLDKLVQSLREQFPDLLLARSASGIGAPILVAVKEMGARGELAVVRVIVNPLSIKVSQFGVYWSCWPDSIHQGNECARIPSFYAEEHDNYKFYWKTLRTSKYASEPTSEEPGYSYYRIFFFWNYGPEPSISNQTIEAASSIARLIFGYFTDILNLKIKKF